MDGLATKCPTVTVDTDEVAGKLYGVLIVCWPSVFGGA